MLSLTKIDYLLAGSFRRDTRISPVQAIATLDQTLPVSAKFHSSMDCGIFLKLVGRNKENYICELLVVSIHTQVEHPSEPLPRVSTISYSCLDTTSNLHTYRVFFCDQPIHCLSCLKLAALDMSSLAKSA